MSEKKWKIESEMCNVSKNVQKAKTNLDIFCLYKLSLSLAAYLVREIFGKILFGLFMMTLRQKNTRQVCLRATLQGQVLLSTASAFACGAAVAF